MAENGKNGTSSSDLVLSRAAKRVETALPLDDDDDRERLDQEELVQWMLEKSSPRLKKQQCVVFTLVHDHKVNGSTQLTTSTVIDKKLSDADREEIVRSTVSEFDVRSERTARGFADVQRFLVHGYLKDGFDPEDRKEGSEFSTLFLVEPPMGSKMTQMQSYGDPGSGSVDAVQIVSTFASSLEKKDKQNSQNMQSMFERLTEMNMHFCEQLKENVDARIDTARKLEESLNDRARREAEARDQNMRTDVMWMVANGLMTWGKGLFERWMAARERALGMGASPEQLSEKDAPFLEFAKTLKPEQLLGIVQQLDRDQQRMFVPMLNVITSQMPPEQAEFAGALFAAWRDSLEAQALEEKRAQSDPGVKVTVTETPKAADKKEKGK